MDVLTRLTFVDGWVFKKMSTWLVGLNVLCGGNKLMKAMMPICVPRLHPGIRRGEGAQRNWLSMVTQGSKNEEIRILP